MAAFRLVMRWRGPIFTGINSPKSMARKRATNGPETGGTSANLGLEAKRWPAAEQAVPAPHYALVEYNGACPGGLLGLIFGVPPKGNSNFAWVQHFIHHLAPHGMAGFVLANGSRSSNQSGEGEIRNAIIEVDLLDCMVALPGQLFYTTQIPVCLWLCEKVTRSILRTMPVCSMAKRNSAR